MFYLYMTAELGILCVTDGIPVDQEVYKYFNSAATATATATDTDRRPFRGPRAARRFCKTSFLATAAAVLGSVLVLF